MLKAGSKRLVLIMKAAYWVGIFIIAAMMMTSYLMVQQMLGNHQQHESLLSLVNAQKVLSQRILFLANASERAPWDRKPAFVADLEISIADFEHNYRVIVEQPQLAGRANGQGEASELERLFFGEPHNLDRLTASLVANGKQFIDIMVEEIALREGEPNRPTVGSPARLDRTVADATLDGYAELDSFIKREARARLGTMLTSHRNLFFATIGIIVLVVLLIFRPMSNIISRKTDELVEARNSMARLAAHDGLTGLQNRTFLTGHFDSLLNAAARRGERLAVLQIDLDRFKQINDTLGHAAGDLVLIKTAERMRAACRASDLCVRLGGDEFVILLSGAGGSKDIDTIASRVLRYINEPIDFDGATIHPGASAGIAVYPVDAMTTHDLLVHADLALYAAKKEGGGSLSFFSDELRAELEQRKRLEKDIARAIEERAFTVHYQPQISLRDGVVTGVEALVRWHHAERGMIAPADFIPVAEKSGQMSQIGRIVIEKAIAEAAEWHRQGIRFGRLAVNVSGAELREADFARHLFDTLAKAGLPPQKLSLEIVESVILDDEKTGVAAKLRAIRASGVHLELDDFGTGYASLSHVNPSEIDRLKIDRRFVHKIDANGDNTKIVRAITELARGLGISIIAEGAETEAELDLLLSIGCDQVQGYSIAFPMPEGQTREWLSARSPKTPVLTLHRSSVA